MKKPVQLIVTLILFVAIFTGSMFLYNHLKKKYEDDSSVSDATTYNEETYIWDTESDNDANEDYMLQEDVTAPEEDAAPDFTVYDENGNAVRLSDFRGKPVVLNFWASWCYYCKEEMPDFEEAYQNYGDDVQFLMINVTDGYTETLSDAKDFYENSGYSFPVFYDTNLDASTKYDTSGIPSSYFVDRNGNIAVQYRGMISAQNLNAAINQIRNDY